MGGEKIKGEKELRKYGPCNSASCTIQTAFSFLSASKLEMQIDLSEELSVLDPRFTHRLEESVRIEDSSLHTLSFMAAVIQPAEERLTQGLACGPKDFRELLIQHFLRKVSRANLRSSIHCLTWSFSG